MDFETLTEERSKTIPSVLFPVSQLRGLNSVLQCPGLHEDTESESTFFRAALGL